MTLIAAAEVGYLEANIHGVMRTVSLVIGTLGVMYLLWGILAVGPALIRQEIRRLRGKHVEAETSQIRRDLSGYLLTTLEILIAADIIESIATPTLEALGILGGIVLIRTVLTMSLNWELSREAKNG